MRATPSASMSTPSEAYYTPSENGDIIPATQYTTHSQERETQVCNQHANLTQVIEDAIAETGRLKVQGGNVAFKTNILAFLQQAASIAQQLTPTIAEPKTNTSPLTDARPGATQEDPSLREAVEHLSKELKEMKNLFVKSNRTWTQVVSNEGRTEIQGSPN